MLRTLAVVSLSVAAASLWAVGPGAVAQVASPDPAVVRAGTYRVEPAHTQVGFTLSHLGFTNFSGLFSGASGVLQIDPGNLAAAKLEVDIPVQTVLTTVPKLDEELRGAQWFDAAQFPTARFVSTSVTRESPTRAKITGDLTLHGVTRPITLEAHFVGAGVNPLDRSYTLGFEATGVIERGDFGIKAYLPMLGDDVRLTIAGAFERQP
jgi:polyisoprenoid-binding protein YceI